MNFLYRYVGFVFLFRCPKIHRRLRFTAQMAKSSKKKKKQLTVYSVKTVKRQTIEFGKEWWHINISKSFLYCILTKDFHSHAYKLQLSQELKSNEHT